MQSIFGDNAAVDYASAAISGAIGSVVGHGADKALSRSQKGMTISARQLTYGLGTKGSDTRSLCIYLQVHKR